MYNWLKAYIVSKAQDKAKRKEYQDSKENLEHIERVQWTDQVTLRNEIISTSIENKSSLIIREYIRTIHKRV